MSRVPQANIHGTFPSGLSNVATSATVAFDTSSATKNALATGDYFVVVVEPDTLNEEVIYVQGPLLAGATTWPSILRGQESVSAAITHAAGAIWRHGPTVQDFIPSFIAIEKWAVD